MNSKHISFLLYLSSLLLLTSCSSDDDSLSLVLDNPHVEIQPEESMIINVTSGNGNYRTQSADKSVAIAEVDGNTIIVRVLKVGVTTIQVKDKADRQALIYVDVPTLTGAWFVSKYDAIVEASDTEIKEVIKHEVVDFSFIPSAVSGVWKSKYIFHDGIGVDLLVSAKDGSLTYKGSYEFGKKNLSIQIDNKQISFEIIRLSRNKLILKENLTELYKIRYPEIVISEVYRIHELDRNN